jgi:hypothetical protein
MVLADQDRPVLPGQTAQAFAHPSGLIEAAFLASFTIGIGACIDRIGQHLVDARVGGAAPLDVRAARELGGEGDVFGPQPQPDLPDRAGLGELLEDRAEGALDGLVGMEEDLAVLLPPDEPDRQATPQFPPRGLVADAAVQPGADHVEFRFGHCPLQAQQETVIEEPRMVQAVLIADQGVADAAQVQELIPVGVVAGDAGDLDRQDQPDVAQGHFGDHRGQPAAAGRGLGRLGQVLVDHLDLPPVPTQGHGAIHQLVLAVG